MRRLPPCPILKVSIREKVGLGVYIAYWLGQPLEKREIRILKYP